jgi:hypothetical protein
MIKRAVNCLGSVIARDFHCFDEAQRIITKIRIQDRGEGRNDARFRRLIQPNPLILKPETLSFATKFLLPKQNPEKQIIIPGRVASVPLTFPPRNKRNSIGKFNFFISLTLPTQTKISNMLLVGMFALLSGILPGVERQK